MASRDNLRVMFDGEYYELKNFLHDHPGGANTLKYYKHKSIVNAMEKFGHSTSAYHMMRDFKMYGELKDFNLTGEVTENGRIITNDENSRDIEEIRLLEELEGRLDWSKPLLHQLDAIAPQYEKWVNTAVYKKCRLFQSSLLESFTITPWYLVPIFWIPIILYLSITQYLELVVNGDDCPQGCLTTAQFIYQLIQGMLLWTALEYILHRWVFHFNPGSSVILIKIHFLIHGLHHKVPFDGLRQVFPPGGAAVLVMIIYNIICDIFTFPRIKLVGGLVGYLTYDMIHYYVHHGSPRDGTYLYQMKRYHSNHHFLNSNKAFGISSGMWDYVFRTFVNVKHLGFSLQW